MFRTRRNILAMMAAAAAAGTGVAVTAEQPIRAVAFDGLAILDPRPALALAKQLHPQADDAFVDIFQSRLFEYQWLRVLGGHYEDFLSIVDDAHIFAAAQTKDVASKEALKLLRDAFLNLKAWPDSAEALKTLKARGYRIGFLSNMTAGMLEAGLANSGLTDVFDHVLSTDAIRSYKPDPNAYRLGVEAFNLPKEQIAFVAFAGWDAAGASWFGYPTIWVNRVGGAQEQLDAGKIIVSQDLTDLDQLITGRG